MKKKNLLLLGASGGVSSALLQRLPPHRERFDALVLIDKNDAVLRNRLIPHESLKYTFIHTEVDVARNEFDYVSILKKYEIDIVLDLTDMDSIPIIEVTNKLGVDYINTALNCDDLTETQLIEEITLRKEALTSARSLLSTGMNPGVVNIWVRWGIEKFGVPQEIVHFEYDTSCIATEYEPSITWSPHEFLVESVWDPGGIVLGRQQVKELFPNALKHPIDMTSILAPIMELPSYPIGFPMLHEENITLGYRYNIPSKFIYAVDMRTTEFMNELYDEKKTVSSEDLIHVDNVEYPLHGSDSIGVLLKYPDKDVYYYNSISNQSVKGFSATYLQVITGIYATLFALLDDDIANGVYFAEDLFETSFPYYIFQNMHVQEFVFPKTKRQRKTIRPKRLAFPNLKNSERLFI